VDCWRNQRPYYQLLPDNHVPSIGVTVIGEENEDTGDVLLAQFRTCFQKVRLRLLQFSKKPTMAFAINDFSSFYIV
jgi:hypothetical protein